VDSSCNVRCAKHLVLVFTGFTNTPFLLPKLDVGGSNPLARFHKALLGKDLRLVRKRETSS